MRIAPVSMGYTRVPFNYNILSINGNPRSLGRVEAVSDVSKRTSPLVVMQRNAEEASDEENGIRQRIPSVASGGFADMIKLRQETAGGTGAKNRGMDTGYIRDTMNIMMMGVSRNIPTAESI